MRKIHARGKTRTRQHVIADLGVNYVERRILKCGFTAEKVRHDYGYDLVMWTFNDRGKIEHGVAYIQVKSTDRLPLTQRDTMISWTVDRRDLKLWIEESYPVVLVVYDAENDNAYWAFVNYNLEEGSMSKPSGARATMTIRIPTANRFNMHSVRRIAKLKRALQQATDQ